MSLDSTKIIAAVQEQIDAATVELNATIARQASSISTLQAEFDAYKASHPATPPTTPPVDPPTTPPSTGFPDATSTGPKAGTVFTDVASAMTISKAGTYKNLLVHGGINVTVASGVIIEDCIVMDGGIFAENGRPITVRRCRIDGRGKFAGSAGIQAFGFFEGNDIQGHENGIVVQAGSNGWAKGNYIHALRSSAADGHYDGIAIQEKVDGFLIEGNAIWGRDTSDVFLKGDFGPVSNITINANLLAIEPGQEKKTAFVVNISDKAQRISNVRVTNNSVQKAAFGDISVDPKVVGAVVSGNTPYKG